MNAIELMRRFHRFEKDYAVFDQLVNDLPWWDSVRYDVYAYLGQLLQSRGSIVIPPPLWKRRAGDIKRIAARWRLLFELGQDPGKILLFRAPRAWQDGRYVDNLVDPISALFPGRTSAINTFPSRYHVPVIQASSRLGSVPVDLDKTIAALLDVFGISQSQAKAISKIIRVRRFAYEVEVRGYERILKRARPELIVVVQNGIEKALFNVAHRNGIPTAEVQHGRIGYPHGAYSYSPDIDYHAQSTFPDLFLTFSDHWKTTCYYPNASYVPIGNDSYFVQPMANQMPGTALVISADIYHKTLTAWVRAIAEMSPQRRILYKLHPNQIANASNIKEEFCHLTNVQIVDGEIPASNLLQEVSHIITVCSTVVYEALQAGRTVCIIPEHDYLSHQDIFQLPGVVVPTTPEELNLALDVKTNLVKPPRFFDQLDPLLARSSLEDAIRQRAEVLDKIT